MKHVCLPIATIACAISNKLEQSCGVKNPNLLEMGVAVGDFSAFLVDEISPAHFAAVDLFDLHESEIIWGMRTFDMFQGKTHGDFQAQKMASIYSGDLRIEQGLSADAIGCLLEDALASPTKIRLGALSSSTTI